MKWIRRMLGKVKKKRHGFTLIELMVVLIIIAILAVAAVPTYLYFVHRAYESEAAASLGAIKTAELVYKAEHDTFSAVWGPLGIGMTSADFAQNKWFHSGCFSLESASTDDFTAYCDGSRDGEPEVEDIAVFLTATGDITRGTTGQSGTQPM